MVTLPTEAAPFSTVSSSASPSDSPISNKAMLSTLISSPEAPPKKHVWTAGTRMLSKEGWEELKPTIRHLYLDENRTLKQLTEHIYEHYEVKPTKKQLTHRISRWGFEKNVKRAERRAIIQNLSSEIKTAGFEAKSIRGRTLDKAKLGRWMKQEGLFVETAVNEQGGSSSTACKQDFIINTCTSFADNRVNNLKSLVRKALASNAPAEQGRLPCGTESAEVDPLVQAQSESTFDWKVVDIVGSPRLGRLIGALTVEARSEIPFLDLASIDNPCFPSAQDESQMWPSIFPGPARQCHPNSNTSWTFRLDILGRELYPFPQRGNNTWMQPATWHYPATSTPWTEPECIAQYKLSKGIEGDKLTKLVASITHIAYKYASVSQFGKAEKWYRHIVTIAERMPKQQLLWLLKASLDVIDSIELQGRYTEAQGIFQDLYIGVQRTLGSNHPLALEWKQLQQRSLRRFGKQDEEEKTTRELVQTFLNSHGAGYADSINSLHCLGMVLQRQSRFLESEFLLSTVITLRNESTPVYVEPCKESNRAFTDQLTLLAMLHLVRSLNKGGKCFQSEDILKEVKKRFQGILERSRRSFLHYQNEVACTKRLVGDLDESEEILRDLLSHYQSTMSPNRRINIIQELGEILCETNRLEEATSWFQQEFAVLLDNIGLENSLTKTSCKKLGLCYAELGRYDEANEHFEQMIRRLGFENPQSIHNRQEYIREIEGWMKEVDDMRLADLATYLQEFEGSMSDDTSTEDLSEEESITLETPGEFTHLE
ncbi:hypothetical protein N431DRAFT_406481 [Stipitochalara longipes BDJ]|nr:hypothetical protein N431DRAFT_406481 [Stipitochalara longipes BDJ]